MAKAILELLLLSHSPVLLDSRWIIYRLRKELKPILMYRIIQECANSHNRYSVQEMCRFFGYPAVDITAIFAAKIGWTKTCRLQNLFENVNRKDEEFTAIATSIGGWPERSSCIATLKQSYES